MKKDKSIYVLIILMVFSIGLIPITLGKYISSVNRKIILNIVPNTYTVVFHSNNGLDEEETQDFVMGESQNLRTNTFTYGGLNFSGWNTEIDGSGTRYSDGENVVDLTDVKNDIVDLYAQWSDGVAMVNGEPYSTLQDAIDKVDTDGVLTTVILLVSTGEHVKVYQGQNIEFDFGNNTLSNTLKNQPVVDNYGTLTIKNGTITTDATAAGAINNRENCLLNITGGSVITTGDRQAVYNERGTINISGDPYLYSSGTQRAAVQNTSNSTMNITGGTIISTGHSAVNNAGVLTIGTKNNDPDSNIILRGEVNGLLTTTNFNYYDGVIYGKSSALSSYTKYGELEDGYSTIHEKEVIDSVTYDKIYLGIAYIVTFNARGGTMAERTRGVKAGATLGTLPSTTRPEYVFDGWYTASSGGEKITSDTVITGDVTFYAHWHSRYTDVAEMDGIKYNALTDAVSAALNKTHKEITLLKDISTSVSVRDVKDITIDLNGHTINSVASKAVFENNGTLKIKNGTINTNTDISAINNNSGNLTVDNVTITSIAGKQAIFILGGTVIIDGNSYLTSNTCDISSLSNLERGTVHTLQAGTLIVKSGTIVGTKGNAISNEGTATIGIDDGVIDNSTITIMGKTNGLETQGMFSFYDGVIKGIDKSILGAIDTRAANTTLVNDIETIDTDTYKTVHLELN